MEQIFSQHSPGLTARLRLRLINHLGPALLLCFLFKCRIDGFFLHFIDLCIMVLSLRYSATTGKEPSAADVLAQAKTGGLGFCVAYCSAWRN